MKKLSLLALAGALVLSACTEDNPKDNDQRLWYDEPATTWLEALPLGNSRMGAMIYGGVQEDEIQLNEETFWSGSRESPIHRGAPRHEVPHAGQSEDTERQPWRNHRL